MSDDLTRCPRCGRRIDAQDRGRFCPHCFSDLQTSDETAALEQESGATEPGRTGAQEPESDTTVPLPPRPAVRAPIPPEPAGETEPLLPPARIGESSVPEPAGDTEPLLPCDEAGETEPQQPAGETEAFLSRSATESPVASQDAGQDAGVVPGFPVAGVADPGPRPASPRPATENGNGCPLRVRFNAAQVFVAGCEMPFHFQITPLQAGLSDLCVEIRHHGRIVARDESPWELEPEEALDIPIGYEPAAGLHGKVTFDVVASCRKGSIPVRHSCKVIQFVHKGDESGALAFRDINVTVTNNIHQGHAADAEVNNQLDLDQLARIKQFKGSSAELQLVDIPPRWLILSMHRMHGGGVERAPDDPPVDALANRLLLRWRGRELILLNTPAFQGGRSRDCDVMARVYNRDGSQNVNDCLRISRYHFRIERFGPSLILRDQAWNPREAQMKPSDNGTWLDGQRLPSGGTVELPVDRAFLLGAAGYTHGVTFEGIVNSAARAPDCICAGKKAPRGSAFASLVLRRPPPAAACAAVWSRMDLGDVWEDLRGVCLCRREGAFALRTEGGCCFLMPGQSYSVRGENLEVSRNRSNQKG